MACAVRNVLFGRYLARVRWLGVAKLEAGGQIVSGKGAVENYRAPPSEPLMSA